MDLQDFALIKRIACPLTRVKLWFTDESSAECLMQNIAVSGTRLSIDGVIIPDYVLHHIDVGEDEIAETNKYCI